jgi:hypothetical protein
MPVLCLCCTTIYTFFGHTPEKFEENTLREWLQMPEKKTFLINKFVSQQSVWTVKIAAPFFIPVYIILLNSFESSLNNCPEKAALKAPCGIN